MIKVITYGTYDFLHYGHIRLLKRAKALGDYLIVGVTSDDFDKARGKINVQQSLDERIAAIRATGIPDKIIVEEYEGQKIDDIRRFEIDIFTVGSDWVGFFDYLNDYCQVVYLSRTEGVSSTEIRTTHSQMKLGMVGYAPFMRKVFNESKFVNAINVVGICVPESGILQDLKDDGLFYTTCYEELLEKIDSVYIHAHPSQHYSLIKKALEIGKHVMCESPLTVSLDQLVDLFSIAEKNSLILMETCRTAYITAYTRMLLLLKSGIIGDVVSIDATCSSLSLSEDFSSERYWGAIEAWGPTTMLPVFHILGTSYLSKDCFSLKNDNNVDYFTKVNFNYTKSTATIKVGTGVKSEGQLIVSGTKGYIYVPAPWWKMDYFEIRYENPSLNRRYFYQIKGEGIRYEFVEFLNAIKKGNPDYYISRDISSAIVKVISDCTSDR